MTIAPTLDGGLKLIAEDNNDWEVLLCIKNDAGGDLASRLSTLMDEDSMWDEIVEPELVLEFSAQVEFVHDIITKARSQEPGEDEVVINKDAAENWYGALNQARLNLENHYRFGPRELQDADEIKNGEERSAFFRDEFYMTIQSLLLRYVMS